MPSSERTERCHLLASDAHLSLEQKLQWQPAKSLRLGKRRGKDAEQDNKS
jgi:hypothetical protein